MPHTCNHLHSTYAVFTTVYTALKLCQHYKKSREDLSIQEDVCRLYANTTQFYGASLIAQLVKNLPVMQETPIQFLGWEDPLQKG